MASSGVRRLKMNRLESKMKLAQPGKGKNRITYGTGLKPYKGGGAGKKGLQRLQTKK